MLSAPFAGLTLMGEILPNADLDLSLTMSILASLALADGHAHPYANWRLSRLFPEPVVHLLAELPLAPPELGGISGTREAHNDARQYFAGDVLSRHPVTRRIAEAFQSPAIARAFAAHTGARLDGTYLRIEYAVDSDGFWLRPHTDLGVKALTLLVQLGQDDQADLGTDLYETPDAWRERVAFDRNGALLFVPSDRTWHGFERREIKGVRRSVIVNYVTADWREGAQLAFPTQAVSLA
jgi:hypothetical protein